MDAGRERLEGFLALSSVLTGFDDFHLKGTGQAEVYLDTARGIAGEKAIDDLLAAFRTVVADAGGDESALEVGLRRAVLSHEKLGPLARHIIKLWYVGIWYELPADWREAYGENDDDRTFVVSPSSYTEGLLWPAIGANPSGAKPFGYGMWAMPPRVDQKED